MIRTLVASHWRLALLATVALGAAPWLLNFPVRPVLLGMFYLATIALVLWRPIALFSLVPAALPMLDLAPWSGRHYIDEFDVLLALTCTTAWARRPSQPQQPVDRHTMVLVTGILMVLTVGVVRSLWPWPGLQAPGFGYPLGSFNALRIAKGGLWALVLFLLARSWQAAGKDVQGPFALGMILGLFGVILWILAERMAFTGLTDVAADYRISGPFAAMSLGGAYVEGFLVVATPFLVLKLLPPVQPLRQFLGALLLAGATYSLAVTFSRGGYAAMAVGILVLGLTLAAAPGVGQRKRMLVFVGLAALVVSVAYPVLGGSFARSRMNAAEADLAVRERHWVESLQAMDKTLTTQAFGMGLGSYPSVRFWDLPPGRRAGAHQLLTDDSGTPMLRLGASTSYYIEQIVPVQAGNRYRLEALVRHDETANAPAWSLCQKWIIASFECGRLEDSATNKVPRGDRWLKVSQTIVAPAAGPTLLPRPHRLSLSNRGDQAIDIASVSLTDAAGNEVVRNGRFDAGLDHWTVTSDDHLAWHIKSMPLGLYFELGLFGAIASALLLVSSAWRAAAAAFAGHRAGATLLAAMCAFVVVGLFDTLIDEPRFLMLWLLLCLWAQLLPIRRT